MGCGKSPLNKFADGGYVSFLNEKTHIQAYQPCGRKIKTIK